MAAAGLEELLSACQLTSLTAASVPGMLKAVRVAKYHQSSEADREVIAEQLRTLRDDMLDLHLAKKVPHHQRECLFFYSVAARTFSIGTCEAWGLTPAFLQLILDALPLPTTEKISNSFICLIQRGLIITLSLESRIEGAESLTDLLNRQEGKGGGSRRVDHRQAGGAAGEPQRPGAIWNCSCCWYAPSNCLSQLAVESLQEE